jgi:hypothetical protein
MKNIRINALALVIGFTLSSGVIADNMTLDQYKSLETKIEYDYKVAKDKCDSLAGNDEDICEAEVKGKMDIDQAELKHSNKPTPKTLYKARVAKADADYSLAIQKCDEKVGNAEDVCVKEAKAAKIQETASAEAQMKTLKADDEAIDKSYHARKDAEKDMRDANYAVAKEKCEALDGKTEVGCMSNVKSRFGK